MTITILCVSILLQFLAAAHAMHLAARTRHVAFGALALAVLMMSVQRCFTLYNMLTFNYQVDPTSEILALIISILILIGLVGLIAVRNRHQSASPDCQADSDAPETGTKFGLAKTAIVLGLIVFVATAATGLFAYRASREVLLQSMSKRNLSLARALSNQIERYTSVDRAIESLESVNEIWDRIGGKFSQSYLCLMDARGNVLLNSADASAVGEYIGDLSINERRANGSRTLGSLVTAEQDWSGGFTSRNGEQQIVGIVTIPNREWLAAIHTPTAVIDKQVKAGVFPWVIGLSATTFLLLPLSLGLLYWSYSVSYLELRQSKRELHSTLKTERLLMRELDHRVRNNLASLISLLETGRKSTVSGNAQLDAARSRIQAMALVHSALSECKWRNLSLRTLITSIIRSEFLNQVSFEGSDVIISSTKAQAIGLVLNELTTNSRKYGALRSPTGHIAIRWDLCRDEDGNTQLVVSWGEVGGPPIQFEPKRGTGLSIVEGLIKYDMNGGTDLSFLREGVQHRFWIMIDDLPVPEISVKRGIQPQRRTMPAGDTAVSSAA